MNDHFTVISVKARLGELPSLIAAIRQKAVCLGGRDAEIKRLELVVEELFLNSVTHGHGGDSDAVIDLELMGKTGDFHLHYRDDAPPFDLEKYTPADISIDHPGGHGIRLLRAMSKAIRYTRHAGSNRIELDF